MKPAPLKKTIDLLDKHYPAKQPSLHYKNPLQMLVATILSAQCTDKRVNTVTPALFKRYKTAKDYATTDIKELERYIKSTGFYHNKAKNIKKTGALIVDEFNNNVPDTMKELISLHGVARKTANIVLSKAYGKVEGIAVDTHVKRIAYRLGWTHHTNPDKVEQDLLQKLEKKHWWFVNHVLVDHGRALCKAPTPICSTCFLNKICPQQGVTKKK